ncbi:hypothetical protein K6L09_20520 [Burkholderia cepacia]
MTQALEFLNLKPYNQEEWEKRNTHWSQVRNALDLQAIWSIYEVENIHAPAIEGQHTVYFMGRFNPAESKDEARKISLSNPTWLDLWKAADELIREREAGGRTDLYVEGFEPDSAGHLEIKYGS